jgi:heme-degrading monooxygenase HmoA
MYARSTTIQGDPQYLDDGMMYVHDEVMPAVTQMDGCVGISMLADRGSGRCIVTTSWADEMAMRGSAEGVRTLRERAADIFHGNAEVAEWEIAVLHRMHASGDGACTRVMWTRGDPGNLDRMIDSFRMSVLPRLEELTGFCSVSLMVDRTSGRCATATTYDTRDAMAQALAPVTAMREEFTTATGMEITEVLEFDLVLAHLRVPETV